MRRATKIVRNLYRDSVSLMQLSDSLSKVAGVEQASVVMATPANISLLREAGFIEGTVEASPNDVLIVVSGRNDATLAAAMDRADNALHCVPASDAASGMPGAVPPKSIEMALAAADQFALISTPGEYAAAEAMKRCGLALT
jgi:hypothetical protein